MRKIVTMSLTFETVLEVDEDLFKKAEVALSLSPSGVYLMMISAHTKILEKELECAVILNVEDADE